MSDKAKTALVQKTATDALAGAARKAVTPPSGTLSDLVRESVAPIGAGLSDIVRESVAPSNAALAEMVRKLNQTALSTEAVTSAVEALYDASKTNSPGLLALMEARANVTRDTSDQMAALTARADQESEVTGLLGELVRKSAAVEEINETLALAISERDARIVRLAGLGATRREIAQAAGMSAARVQQIIDKHSSGR